MPTDKLELADPNSRTEVKIAIAALLTAVLIIAVLPILFRVSESSIGVGATMFNRFWIATTVLGLWHGLSLIKWRSPLDSQTVKLFPDTHSLLLLVILAIFFVGFQLLWGLSLTQTSVANSEVMHSLTPLFTTLIGWSLFGQKFDRIFLMGIGIALIGAIALAANDFSIALDRLTGDGLALVSAMLWAGFLLIMEKLQTQLSIRAITTWNWLLGTLFLLPIILMDGDEIFPYSWGGWITVIILGMAAVFILNLIAYSLKSLSSGFVATILLINPIVTAILAWVIFSETLNLLNWLAFFVILLGIYITTWSKHAIQTSS